MSLLSPIIERTATKIAFRRSRVFHNLGVDSCFFLLDLGLILVTFGALRTGLKLDDFPWPLGVVQNLKPEQSGWWVAGFWVH